MEKRVHFVVRDLGVVEAVKARAAAEGVSLVAWVEGALRMRLERDGRRPLAPEGLVEAQQDRPVGAPRRVRAGRTARVSDAAHAEEVARSADVPRHGCRRCGHPEGTHWGRGCLGTCTCTQARYLPPGESSTAGRT